MIVRRRGMPLLRGALIGGMGYAAGKSSANNAQREASQNEAIAALQQTPQVPQAPAVDVTAQLTQLGQMVTQGLLTPEEFAAAKAKLLGA